MTRFRILAVMAPETGGAACKQLSAHYDIQFTQTLRPTLAAIQEFDPDVILIDIDANTRGKVQRITQSAKAHYRKPFIILMKSGRGLPKGIAYYDTLLSRPFVSKKLHRTIEKLLDSRSDYVIQVAPFTLDRRTNVLVRPNDTIQLSPKLSKMLALFMETPRQPVSSMTLLKKVWGSSKSKNTRTLHVHMHWLRRLIEEDVSEPQYLKTADKNMGYVLDLPGEARIGGEPLSLKV